MNITISMVWRGPCAGILPSAQRSSPVVVRDCARSFCRNAHLRVAKNKCDLNIAVHQRQTSGVQKINSPFISQLRSSFRLFSTSRRLNAQHNSSATQEEGLRFQQRELSHSQISRIFGTPRIPPALGNRILRVLHGRRVAGTLDLDLPPDIRQAVPSHVLDDCLRWLRQNFPVDEDAAIMRRIEREEQEEEERLIRRAEELGLYKPQSGKFGAEKEKEGDVYGHSVLQEIRQANEKVNKRKEREERQEWLESEAKEKENIKMSLQRNTELAKYEESAITEGRAP